MVKIFSNESSKFMDIRAKLFQNKNNGQISLALPKKQLKKMIDFGNSESIKEIKIPKSIPIRIFKWS